MFSESANIPEVGHQKAGQPGDEAVGRQHQEDVAAQREEQPQQDGDLVEGVAGGRAEASRMIRLVVRGLNR